ncbi:probable E3 ubiquitin-protein ligase HECTD2 [Chaetodon trifascialis]|uniref:probable E3 ubiquitin-protein ligase HECTD2 n=1 Tax=Chaetodon trifascialis TaxID=109706 RepID=UPI0039955E14
MDGEHSALSGVEREREKLPPIYNSSPPAGLGRGAKQPFPSFGTFISTLSQRRDAGGRGFTGAMTGTLTSTQWFRHGRELPPICSDVRQKQRLSIDTLPPEVKAPFPCDPVIPLRTKTTKDFQEDMEHAVQSGDWREIREFYLTTFDSFIEINAAFKREANGSFNTVDDSGVNAKFVNAVYDALLSTVSETNTRKRAESCLSLWFSFCQFPFILSTVVKKAIIQKDSEQQMISQARQSLVNKVSRRQRVDMNLLFLNIKVRRAQLLSDSLDELTRKRCDLKKKLRVTFVGEAGLDMGGLTKEWFLLLVRQIFHTDYGMFTYMKDSRCHWFSSWKCDNYSEFQLVGTLMGLAVYNSIALDIHFPLYCYRKLLTPPTVPSDQNALVGNATATLDDLQQIMPELAHGLGELLSYEGNVEEDFYLTFQVFQEEMGMVKSYNLKPGGDKIPVTKQNRKEYVQLYVDFLLNKSISKQFAAFYHGFHSVCASDALMLLRPEEVEMLVCGSPELDMSALQKAAQYEGYGKTDTTVRCFWDVVLAFPLELQKKLLHFATGSDRVPVGGMADLNFKISKIDVPTDWLPISHTCFNQICLPPYRTRKELKHKLTIAISNAEGFGLE